MEHLENMEEFTWNYLGNAGSFLVSDYHVDGTPFLFVQQLTPFTAAYV